VLGVRTGAHFVSVSTICFRFDIGNAPSLFWEENCPFVTNNKNLGKRVKNQKHTCTIHMNTANSFIPLGSNIQLKKNSTNTEKEQVIIKTNL
jgi:hypothetical protein